MPWRLIQFIVIFGIFLIFTAFNLKNTSNVNFGFKELEAVPVYLTAFSAFVFGMLCALPFIIRTRMKRKTGQTEGDREKKPAGSWRKKKAVSDDTPADSSFSDGGPYGVN